MIDDDLRGQNIVPGYETETGVSQHPRITAASDRERQEANHRRSSAGTSNEACGDLKSRSRLMHRPLSRRAARGHPRSSMTGIATRATGLTGHGKRFHFSTILILLLLFITACGARTTTLLEVNSDGSGSRFITVQLEKDERISDAIDGDYGMVEETLREYLPDELEIIDFSMGATEITAVFELQFTDVNDYKSKTASLLEQSDARSATTNFSVRETPFQSGFMLTENYSSRDLMGWITVALLEEGLITDGAKHYVFVRSNSATVTYDGHSWERSSNIRIDEGTDRRFDAVDISVEPEKDKWRVDIDYVRDRSPSSEIIAVDDSFFSSLDIDDIELQAYEDNGYKRSASFLADDLNDLGEKLDEALLTNGSNIGYETVQSAVNPLNTSSQVLGRISTESVCKDCTSDIHLKNFPGLPSLASHTLPSFYIQQESPTRVTKFETELSVGLDRKPSMRIAVYVPDTTLDTVLNQFGRALSPPEGLGSISRDMVDNNVVFNVALEPGALEAGNLRGYLAGGYADVTSGDRSTGEYIITWALNPDEMVPGAQIENVSAEVTLGPFNSFRNIPNADESQENSRTFLNPSVPAEGFSLSLGATGPTLGEVLAIALSASVIVIALMLVLIFRKRLVVALRQNQLKRAEKRAFKDYQQASYQAQQDNWYHSAPNRYPHQSQPMPYGPPGSRPDDQFAENSRGTHGSHPSEPGSMPGGPDITSDGPTSPQS